MKLVKCTFCIAPIIALTHAAAAAPQLVKQVQCAETKRTNRVTHILSDGTFVYELICLRNETVVVDKADPPQTVKARYVDGVKPGMFLSSIEDVVTAVWAKPGAAI